MTTDEIVSANLILDPVETSPEHARGDHLVIVRREGPDLWCGACGERLLDLKAPPHAGCPFCENDLEQCHADIDCEARAWANGFCGPHQPDPRSYH